MNARDFEGIARYYAGDLTDPLLRSRAARHLGRTTSLIETQHARRVTSLVFGSTAQDAAAPQRFAALFAIYHEAGPDVTPAWYSRLLGSSANEDVKLTGFGSGMITSPEADAEPPYYATVDHIHLDVRLQWSKDQSIPPLLGGLALSVPFPAIDVRK